MDAIKVHRLYSFADFIFEWLCIYARQSRKGTPSSGEWTIAV